MDDPVDLDPDEDNQLMKVVNKVVESVGVSSNVTTQVESHEHDEDISWATCVCGRVGINQGELIEEEVSLLTLIKIVRLRLQLYQTQI
ncbi:hypothetical protein L6452_26493 [Arctium lappa]|uniref:Uncharacterized protein n=1 Tax=Arctium lappa TaxID=4217 RepID=A0ACB8ZVM7_ARCLA|nr:hypothetical protein L6452_26493 [Arctium lappa]